MADVAVLLKSSEKLPTANEKEGLWNESKKNDTVRLQIPEERLENDSSLKNSVKNACETLPNDPKSTTTEEVDRLTNICSGLDKLNITDNQPVASNDLKEGHVTEDKVESGVCKEIDQGASAAYSDENKQQSCDVKSEEQESATSKEKPGISSTVSVDENKKISEPKQSKAELNKEGVLNTKEKTETEEEHLVEKNNKRKDSQDKKDVQDTKTTECERDFKLLTLDTPDGEKSETDVALVKEKEKTENRTNGADSNLVDVTRQLEKIKLNEIPSSKSKDFDSDDTVAKVTLVKESDTSEKGDSESVKLTERGLEHKRPSDQSDKVESPMFQKKFRADYCDHVINTSNLNNNQSLSLMEHPVSQNDGALAFQPNFSRRTGPEENDDDTPSWPGSPVGLKDSPLPEDVVDFIIEDREKKNSPNHGSDFSAIGIPDLSPPYSNNSGANEFSPQSAIDSQSSSTSPPQYPSPQYSSCMFSPCSDQSVSSPDSQYMPSSASSADRLTDINAILEAEEIITHGLTGGADIDTPADIMQLLNYTDSNSSQDPFDIQSQPISSPLTPSSESSDNSRDSPSSPEAATSPQSVSSSSTSGSDSATGSVRSDESQSSRQLQTISIDTKAKLRDKLKKRTIATSPEVPVSNASSTANSARRPVKPSAPVDMTRYRPILPAGLENAMPPTIDNQQPADQREMMNARRKMAAIPKDRLGKIDDDGDSLLHDLISDLCDPSSDVDSESETETVESDESMLSQAILKGQCFTRAILERMKREGIVDDVINHRNNKGQTPALLACLTNQPKILKILLEYGANPNLEVFRLTASGGGKKFYAPIHLVTERGHFYQQVLQVLLDHDKTDVNKTNQSMETALHCAMRVHGTFYQDQHDSKLKGHLDCRNTVKMLLNRGAAFKPGPNGRTPIHHLAALECKDNPEDYLEFFKYVMSLIPDKRGDLLARRSDDRGTVLHVVAAKRFSNDRERQIIITTLKYLIHDMGVDPTIKDNSEFKPKRYVHNGDQEICDLLTREVKNYKRHLNQKYHKMESQRNAQAAAAATACMQGSPGGGANVIPIALANAKCDAAAAQGNIMVVTTLPGPARTSPVLAAHQMSPSQPPHMSPQQVMTQSSSSMSPPQHFQQQNSPPQVFMQGQHQLQQQNGGAILQQQQMMHSPGQQQQQPMAMQQQQVLGVQTQQVRVPGSLSPPLQQLPACASQTLSSTGQELYNVAVAMGSGACLATSQQMQNNYPVVNTRAVNPNAGSFAMTTASNHMVAMGNQQQQHSSIMLNNQQSHFATNNPPLFIARS